MISSWLLVLVGVRLVRASDISGVRPAISESKSKAVWSGSLIQKTHNVHVSSSMIMTQIGPNCKAGEWSAWSPCTKSCGTPPGIRVRRRAVEPSDCASAEDVSNCAMTLCPVDCVLSDWGPWGSCSQSCHGGKQKRWRTAIQEAQHGGVPCHALPDCEQEETQECGAEQRDCRMNQWTPWTTCSQTCSTGTSSRSRSVEQFPQCGGRPCLCNFKEYKNCFHAECHADCEVGEWTQWSACPKDCAKRQGSMQTRERKVIHINQAGGKECPQLKEAQNCDMEPCTKDCVMSDWEEWSACSSSCYGTSSRARHVVVPAALSGKQCEALLEFKDCNYDCSIACKVGEWTDWGHCSVHCGGGSATRTRLITKQLANGGEACPALSESKSCNCVECGHEDEAAFVPEKARVPQENAVNHENLNTDFENEKLTNQNAKVNNAAEVPAMCYTELYKKHCGGTTLKPLGTYKYGYQPALGSGDLNKRACESICDKFDTCNGFTYRPSDEACFWKGGALNPQLWNGEGSHDCLQKEPKVPCAQAGVTQENTANLDNFNTDLESEKSTNQNANVNNAAEAGVAQEKAEDLENFNADLEREKSTNQNANVNNAAEARVTQEKAEDFENFNADLENEKLTNQDVNNAVEVPQVKDDSNGGGEVEKVPGAGETPIEGDSAEPGEMEELSEEAFTEGSAPAGESN